jgi:aminoglycoside 3-N-acetyltransferase
VSAALSTREGRAAARLLEEARIPHGGVLFIHSAFRGFAQQGFRAEPFIEALTAYMRAGTLAMPAMSWRIVTPANPVFDEIMTPSHVGIVPEIFRRQYASHRSLHPTHSVAAVGQRAEPLLSGHHLDDTPCSPNSPYGRARSEDTHILLIGIGLERCTAVHLGEEEIAPDVYLKPPAEAEIYECRSRDGAAHRVRLRRHLPLNRNFPRFAVPLVTAGRLRRGTLLGVPWLAMAQEDLLTEVFKALRADPRAIIAPPGAPVIP